MKIIKKKFFIVIGILISIFFPTKIIMEYNSASRELNEGNKAYDECLSTAKSAIDSSRKFIDNVTGKIPNETIKSIGISSLLNYEKALKDCSINLKESK